MRVGSSVVRKIILRDVGGEDDRLCGEEAEGADKCHDILVVVCVDGSRLSFFQDRLQLLQDFKLLLQGLVVHGGLAGLRDPALKDLQVGEDKLEVDGLDIPDRVHGAVDMDDVLILKAADHVDNCVTLADIREELVSEALALAGALDEAGNVDELDDCGRDFLRMVQISELFQALVRNGDDADVRVNGTERIICSLRSCFGE